MHQRFQDDYAKDSNVLFYIGDNKMFADVEPKILIGKVSIIFKRNKTVIVSGYYNDTNIVVEFNQNSWQLMTLSDYNQLKSDPEFLSIYGAQYNLSDDEFAKFSKAIYLGPTYYLFNNELRRFYLPNEMYADMFSIDERITVYTEGIYGLIPKYGFEPAKIVEINKEKCSLTLEFGMPIFRSITDSSKLCLDIKSLRIIPWPAFVHLVEKPDKAADWIDNSEGVSKTIITPEIFTNLLYYEAKQQA